MLVCGVCVGGGGGGGGTPFFLHFSSNSAKFDAKEPIFFNF